MSSLFINNPYFFSFAFSIPLLAYGRYVHVFVYFDVSFPYFWLIFCYPDPDPHHLYGFGSTIHITAANYLIIFSKVLTTPGSGERRRMCRGTRRSSSSIQTLRKHQVNIKHLSEQDCKDNYVFNWALIFNTRHARTDGDLENLYPSSLS